MSISPYLQLSSNVRVGFGIEQTFVVEHWSDKRLMEDLRMEGSLGRGLKVLISFSSGFVEEEDVVGLKADYSKLLAYCSIIHLRIY